MPTNVGDTNFFIYLVKFALSSTLLNLHWLISWSQSVYQEIWKIQIYKSGNSCSSTEIHQSIYKACWVRNRIWETVELTSKEQQQQLKVSVPPEPDGREQQNHMECHQGHQPWLLKQLHIQSATQRTMFVSFEREREKRTRFRWPGCDLLLGDSGVIPSSRRRGRRRAGCRRRGPCPGGARRRAPARDQTPGPGAPSWRPEPPPSGYARGGARTETESSGKEIRKETSYLRL